MVCKLFGRAFVYENNREVNVSRLSQVISLCFHAPKHISVSIIGKRHQTTSFFQNIVHHRWFGLADLSWVAYPLCFSRGGPCFHDAKRAASRQNSPEGKARRIEKVLVLV